MLGMRRQPIMFILLLPEEMQKIPRKAAVNKTRRPRRFVKIMFTMKRMIITAIVR